MREGLPSLAQSLWKVSEDCEVVNGAQQTLPAASNQNDTSIDPEQFISFVYL